MPGVDPPGERVGNSSLALDPELMRRLGYRTIDMLVERITGPAGPVALSATPEELRNRLSIPPPEEPVAFDEILEGLERDVLPYVARISHPGYLAFIPGEGTWPGALGDLVASALNIDTCWWQGSSGPSALELVVLDWFRQWVGYPEQAAGVLVSGRIGCQPDSDGLRPGDEHRRDGRARSRLPVRPDTFLGRPGGARARVPPGTGARDRVRQSRTDTSGLASGRDCG